MPRGSGYQWWTGRREPVYHTAGLLVDPPSVQSIFHAGLASPAEGEFPGAVWAVYQLAEQGPLLLRGEIALPPENSTKYPWPIPERPGSAAPPPAAGTVTNAAARPLLLKALQAQMRDLRRKHGGRHGATLWWCILGDFNMERQEPGVDEGAQNVADSTRSTAKPKARSPGYQILAALMVEFDLEDGTPAGYATRYSGASRSSVDRALLSKELRRRGGRTLLHDGRHCHSQQVCQHPGCGKDKEGAAWGDHIPASVHIPGEAFGPEEIARGKQPRTTWCNKAEIEGVFTQGASAIHYVSALLFATAASPEVRQATAAARRQIMIVVDFIFRACLILLLHGVLGGRDVGGGGGKRRPKLPPQVAKATKILHSAIRSAIRAREGTVEQEHARETAMRKKRALQRAWKEARDDQRLADLLRWKGPPEGIRQAWREALRPSAYISSRPPPCIWDEQRDALVSGEAAERVWSRIWSHLVPACPSRDLGAALEQAARRKRMGEIARRQLWKGERDWPPSVVETWFARRKIKRFKADDATLLCQDILLGPGELPLVLATGHLAASHATAEMAPAQLQVRVNPLWKGKLELIFPLAFRPVGVVPAMTQLSLRVARARETPYWYNTWPKGQLAPRWGHRYAAYLMLETSCIRAYLLLPLFWGKADEGCVFNAVSADDMLADIAETGGTTGSQ